MVDAGKNRAVSGGLTSEPFAPTRGPKTGSHRVDPDAGQLQNRGGKPGKKQRGADRGVLGDPDTEGDEEEKRGRCRDEPGPAANPEERAGDQ